jgi:predicted short-subunit dehydrogenase-like oxidoreductase (DUF2520 family)
VRGHAEAIVSGPTLGFVGAGSVGRTLATAFAAAGSPIVMAHARASTALDGAWAWAGSPQDCAAQADVTFLTVPDDRIAEVCRGVTWRPGTAVVHCSGATPLAALASAERDGARVGGFHPLQMFANPAVALAGLAGCTVAIEAGEALAAELEALARRIGLTPRALPAGARARYHASAYYVGPFAIALLREAVAIWQSFGGTEAEALAALSPLLKGTLAAARDRGLAGGMGGCVARGDIGTVRAHLRALDELGADVGSLYRTLASRTVPLALERGSITQEVADRIATVLNDGPMPQ